MEQEWVNGEVTKKRERHTERDPNYKVQQEI
jgi:hypothetical protein